MLQSAGDSLRGFRATTVIAFTAALAACSGSSDRTFAPGDAAAGAAGTTSTGGSAGSGGMAATGGVAGSGGSAGAGASGGSAGASGSAGVGGSAGIAGMGGSGGAPGCQGANRCVGVPADWTGPVTHAAYSGSAPPCPTDYPTQALTGHQNLTPGTASCSCSCGSITLTCGTVSATGWGTTSCGSPQGGISMPLNTCILASSYPTTNSFNFSIGSTSSCASPTVNNTLPTPTWGSNVRVCGGVQDADPGACGSGEICVPPSASPYGSLCIYRSGDHMCPAGFDGTRELVYDDFSDTRACSTCSCTKQNATCTATVTRYQNTSNNCSGSTATLSVGSSSSCITKSSQTSFRTTAVTKNPSASCAKSGGTLSGAASPTGPTTICCL